MNVGSKSYEMQQYQEVLFKLYRGISEVSKAQVIVDSSKTLSHALLVGMGSDNKRMTLKIVHLIRDPRATAFSWQRAVRVPRIQGESFLMKRNKVLTSSLGWLLSNGLVHIVSWLGQFPYLRVCYEDMIPNISRTLREIMSFVLNGDEMAFEFDFLRGGKVYLVPQHSVAGNPMRLVHGETDLRLDDEWVFRMPKIQQATVKIICLPLMRKYGYNLW